MERKESIVLEFEADEGAAIESIQSLTKANKELREERNKLNISTEQGKKRAQEINAVIDQNTSKIKSNVSALEQQKINIGNYASALDNVIPGFASLNQGIQGGVESVKKFTTATKGWMMLGFGVILAALVTVFTLIKTAISQNNVLFDKFEDITNAVGVVVQVVVGRIGKLGEALVALASGNFNEAINLTSQAFGGLADEIENATRQQQLFLDLSRELEDSQRALRIEVAKQENEIKRLVVAAKNRNLTFDEQEDLLRRALRLEEELVSKRQENAQKDLVITARTLRANAEFQQQENENFEQYINRLITGGKLRDDEVDKLIDKIEAVEQARGSSLAFQEKLENSLAAIQEKRAAALEKQNAALAEQADLERANRRAQNQIENTTEDPLIGAFETRAKIITDIDKRMNEDLIKVNKATQDTITKNAKKNTELRVLAEQNAAADVGQILGTVGSLFEEKSIENKVLSTAQAIINTYLAATAALASGSEINPIYGIISAAAAIATGLASVAKINGVQFAEGGWTGPGGKYDAVGIVHADEYVTPKRVKNMPEAQPHLAALERMRLRGYADGGLVTSSVSAPINQQLEMMNIVKNLPAPVVGVKEVTKMQKRVRVKEAISKR